MSAQHAVQTVKVEFLCPEVLQVLACSCLKKLNIGTTVAMVVSKNYDWAVCVYPWERVKLVFWQYSLQWDCCTLSQSE